MQSAAPPKFMRTYVLPAVWLFALPAFGSWFAGQAARQIDSYFLEQVELQIAQAASLSDGERNQARTFYRNLPPSRVCNDTSPELADYRERLSSPCSDLRQFGWIRGLAVASLALGAAGALFMLALALLSLASRSLLYTSFLLGWNGLKLLGAAQTVLQGALAVLLSYWVTAVWAHSYFPKLIVLVAIMAALAAFLVIAAIFRRPASLLPLEGALVDEATAPQLWARVRELSAELGTAPPDQLIAGIDDNFFVTEGAIILQNKLYSGRTLYVSLSLLRILSRLEADAVISHELAHFSGGDTAHSKKLSPLLTHFTKYLEVLHLGFITRPIFHFMLAYYGLFSVALGRMQRQRELLADRTAAKLTSADAIARSLVKIGAYSNYRGRVEEALFGQDGQHAQLAIADRVAEGFRGYARTDALHFDLHSAVTPHPFDSHPPLKERLANVSVSLDAAACEAILLEGAPESWLDALPGTRELELSLWAAYEERFGKAHELSLAYRYAPNGEQERAHVERHFPPLTFTCKKAGAQFSLDYDSLAYSEWPAPVRYADIKWLRLEQGMHPKRLALRVQGVALFRSRRSIAWSKLEQPDAMFAALERYYGRHQYAMQHQAQCRTTRGATRTLTGS